MAVRLVQSLRRQVQLSSAPEQLNQDHAAPRLSNWGGPALGHWPPGLTDGACDTMPPVPNREIVDLRRRTVPCVKPNVRGVHGAGDAQGLGAHALPKVVEGDAVEIRCSLDDFLIIQA